MPRLSRPSDVRPNKAIETSQQYQITIRVPFASITLGEFQFKSPIKLPFFDPVYDQKHPSKHRLMTVQDFFKYTETQSKQFFDELDRDSDGKVTVQDIKYALLKRKLPLEYANEFFSEATGQRWWKRDISFKDFKSLSDEREADMLRAYTSLSVNRNGQVELNGIKETLRDMDFEASDSNARAMLSCLHGRVDEAVLYQDFRNFLLLLPKKKLEESKDPTFIWYESATVLPLGVPADTAKAGRGGNLLIAAAAGAIASGSSTFMMHPLDSIKTRIQSSAGASIAGVIKSVQQYGLVSLYRGIIPATIGAAAMHGVRTGAYEVTTGVMSTLTGGGAELQIQGLASFVGTLLGTGFRIPCEVLKQRLQTLQYNNYREAAKAAMAKDGIKGLFQGTGATLSREIPFYVLGMVLYEQMKAAAQRSLPQDQTLTNGQVIAIGAASGAVSAVLTNPFDVAKTRIMCSPPGQAVNVVQLLTDIVKNEGVGMLFKGALPRAAWIAPLGAMNFAGYEITKRALANKQEEEPSSSTARLDEPQLQSEQEIQKPDIVKQQHESQLLKLQEEQQAQHEGPLRKYRSWWDNITRQTPMTEQELAAAGKLKRVLAEQQAAEIVAKVAASAEKWSGAEGELGALDSTGQGMQQAVQGSGRVVNGHPSASNGTKTAVTNVPEDEELGVLSRLGVNMANRPKIAPVMVDVAVQAGAGNVNKN